MSAMSELDDSKTTEVCHDGNPVHVYEDGFTRGLCITCSDERCDAPVEGAVYTCRTLSYAWGSDKGIDAVVNKVRESGEPYTLHLNPHDLRIILESLAILHDQSNSNGYEEDARITKEVLTGIAESVGIEWV